MQIHQPAAAAEIVFVDLGPRPVDIAADIGGGPVITTAQGGDPVAPLDLVLQIEASLRQPGGAVEPRVA
ncbi:hypothetical protein G6F63_014319 [Rhizopus arrhizus]|nr:hypothetical protein G6F63_014319 [Rhizopus arrhizus]